MLAKCYLCTHLGQNIDNKFLLWYDIKSVLRVRPRDRPLAKGRKMKKEQIAFIKKLCIVITSSVFVVLCGRKLGPLVMRHLVVNKDWGTGDFNREIVMMAFMCIGAIPILGVPVFLSIKYVFKTSFDHLTFFCVPLTALYVAGYMMGVNVYMMATYGVCIF